MFKSRAIKRSLTTETPSIIETIRLMNSSSNKCNHERNESPQRQDRLEDYIVGKEIGSGAHSTVNIAIHKQSSEQVAIKSYEKSILNSSSRYTRIIREISVMQELSHPNVVRFIEKIESPRRLYIVMEYIQGTTLSKFLKPNRKLTENECKLVFKQIANGLAYCHSRDITHRDIKLDNILVTDTLQVKIIDFGYSTHIPGHKKMKVFCGTPKFMAPEIVSQRDFAGPPADVWAVGVLLYVLLSGTYPFTGSSERELFASIANAQVHVPSSVSREAASLLYKMLRAVPEDRLTIEQVLTHRWINNINERSD